MVIDQGMVANVNIKYQLKMVYIFHALVLVFLVVS